MKFVDEKLENYCIEKSSTPSNVCDEIERYTKEKVDMSVMLVGRLEASFLGFLVRSRRVNRILEVGTFTGYSALAMAENLPPGGKVVTIDVNEETTSIARSFWSKSEHGEKIEARVGKAVDIIPALTDGFDLVFIDADKMNYLNYLELALSKLAEDGVIVLDNCLWSGKVLDQDVEEESARAIQRVNDFIAQEEGLYGTLLPVRDGMFLVQRG